MGSIYKPKNCITFAPFLKELNGHVLDYHQSLHRMLNSKGWQVETLLPRESELLNLPSNWVKELDEPVKWSRRSFFARLFPLLFNAFALSKMIRSYYKAISSRIQTEKGEKTVLFFETFNTFHLYALACILPFLPIKNLHLWILYRYDSKQLFFKGKKDRLILKFLKKILIKNRLTLFADTDALTLELSEFFKEKVHLIPIPHTHGIYPKEVFKKNAKSLTLWWPGVPRRPKGLHVIQKLCETKAPEGYSFCLRVSEKTPDLKEPLNFKLERVQENLDRRAYLDYLHKSDAILLPYNLWNYQYSSSGIFIEAISAGKVPFVSRGLWISQELIKHDLSELILDFESPTLFDDMAQLLTSESVENKLIKMCQHYREFHNEPNTASFFLQHI
jgi:hypothetical protein